jgi:hypothetical protein
MEEGANLNMANVTVEMQELLDRRVLQEVVDNKVTGQQDGLGLLDTGMKQAMAPSKAVVYLYLYSVHGLLNISTYPLSLKKIFFEISVIWFCEIFVFFLKKEENRGL